MNVRAQIKDTINKAFSFESIDEFVCVNLPTDVVTNQLNLCYNDLGNFFSTISNQPNQGVDEIQEIRKEAIQELVNQIFQQKHTKKQLLIIRLLTKLVNTKIVEVRFVCEYMLNHMVYSSPSSVSTHKIEPTNTYIWCKILECIRNFIPLHDYKSCRDIFKMLLEVVKRIPRSNSNYPRHLETELLFIKSARKHKLNNDYNTFNDEYSNVITSNNLSLVTDDIKLESLYETLSFLLDSANYFMPRYLAINEIKTVLTFGKDPYHPRFHTLFTNFIESFIPTAHLISVSGRDRLLPIVGFSNLYSLYSFWRFNPTTCKFNTSGPLPYFKHVSKPHHQFFYYLLRQNTPQYLILGLMSVQRNIKTRFHVFEEEFVKSIMNTMELTEANPNNNFENLRIWNNLVNHLVNSSQNIHVPSIMQQLSALLKKKSSSFKVSRDWLMWFLLLIISSYMNRSCLPEFPDLYDILYKDDEMLPQPDLKSFISVVKLASLSIWIHLNIRQSNQDGSAGAQQNQNRLSNKNLVIPEILRNHYTLLQESLNYQQFQDFGLSICLNAYSTETSFFTPAFNSLLDKIGKNAQPSQQLNIGSISSGTGSPNNSFSSLIFTNHQPLNIEMIASFTLHVRIHLATYLTYILIQKSQNFKVLNLNIPASIVETFARLIIFDPDNFMKYFTQNVWTIIMTTHFSNVPPLSQQQQQLISSNTNPQLVFLHQQLNLLIELICFRLKNLSFTHRTSLLILLNSLFSPSSGQSQQVQQQQNVPHQQQVTQQPTRSDINFLRHPIIYANVQCAMLKLISSFSGSDYYELLNSIHASNKHAPKHFINSESEEINKAIVMLIVRAIHLTSSDLHPFENKEKDDILCSLLREIMQKTPIYFHDYVLEHFPKVIQEFFKEQQASRTELFYIDSSNKQYKFTLKKKVDEDLKIFLESRHEAQILNLFNQTNQINAYTIFCVFFNILLNESLQQNLTTFLRYTLYYLNSSDNKRIYQSIRTFCDYLVHESANKSPEIIMSYVHIITRMINVYNLFTYDRFFYILAFRSFDSNDYQLTLQILNYLFVKNGDFQNKLNDFMNFWTNKCGPDNDEWNPNFYANFISLHPDKFYYEGLKEQIGLTSNDLQINTYYGNMIMRCVPVLDFLNNRYIELNFESNEAENLLDLFNSLYKFHNNPISFVYNSLMYYNNKFQSTNGLDMTYKLKKKRLFSILTSNQLNSTINFSPLFSNYLTNMNGQEFNNQDIAHIIDINYYYNLIQILVKRMLDKDSSTDFNTYKSEFQNPSCHLLYTTLCELISLKLYTNDSQSLVKSICPNIVDMFFVGKFQNQQYSIERKEFDYWINAAGILIANLPESYWQPIYELLADMMKTDEILNSYERIDENVLLDQLDLYLAIEKNCFTRLTLIVSLFHSIWCHSSANHFQYFFKFLKERRENLVRTEYHFLFICKLIGPFLSKIHIENTNLLIELAQELYDMIYLVDRSSKEMYHMETICNFFYHLKYRHIGESIKEKIHSIMPNFRPELKTLFKYITSELNQQLQMQQQQQQNQQQIVRNT